MSGSLQGMRLRYDRNEDRMVLSFEAEGRAQRFWITRRQCAGLVASMGPRAVAAATATPLPRGKVPGGAADPDAETPPVLAAVSLRQTAKGVRFYFRRGEETVTLDCTTAEFAKLQCVFYRLALAAGWALESRRAARAAGPSGRAAVRQLH